MYTNTDIAIGGLIQATSEYKYAMKVYVNFEETRAKVKELVESNKMLLSGDAFKTLEDANDQLRLDDCPVLYKL